MGVAEQQPSGDAERRALYCALAVSYSPITYLRFATQYWGELPMRVRGWLSWLLVLLCGLAIPPTVQAQGEAKAFIDDVKTKLAKGLEHLTGQNYREIKREPVQALEKNKSKRIPLDLQVATNYAIVVACDSDCAHVKIALHDGDGRLLMESPERHHTVIVGGAPEKTSRHTAVISVPGCEDEDCYVGLVLLRQGGPVSDSTGPAPAVAGALHVGPPQQFANYDNYDLVGRDIRHIKQIDLEGCVSACVIDGQCIGYSFDKWNRYCFLKAATGAFRLEPNTISGLRQGTTSPAMASTPATMQRYRNKAFPFKGQETSKAESFEDCETRCAAQDACVAFTYFKISGQCRLMHTTGEYFADSKADSGVKRQEPQ
jgi:hypothetical protein